jgi:hypothetical protein
VERRDVQIGLAVIGAAVIGFAIALLVTGGGSDKTGSAVATTNGTITTTTSVAPATGPTGATGQTTPTTPTPTTASCIALWNEPANRGAQTFLINIASQQPIRVHVGESAEVPPKCLVTVVGNNGDAYVFPEGGGTAYPYSPGVGRTESSTLPAAQRTSNALEQRDGTLQPH